MSSSKPWLLVVLLAFSTRAFGGPPFLTDDPEPVPFRHYEAYAFGTADHASGSSYSQLPAFEFNFGAAPNLMLHVIVPGAYVTPQHAYGIGDVELGVKYRFVQEGRYRPQIGTFPLLELPSGNRNLGLGNGQLWARIPLWLQKSFGDWTTYGGVGYQVNQAPGMKNSLFAGWLLQRAFGKRWTLGSEVYHAEAQEVGSRQATFLDAGGYYNIRENLSVLFMAGHTVSGESHVVGYVGLYYTWGNRDHKSAPAAEAMVRTFLRRAAGQGS